MHHRSLRIAALFVITILRGASVSEAQGPYKIDPDTPLAQLLPARPDAGDKLPTLIDDDFAQVPEVMFGEPISSKLSKWKALEQTGLAMAKINHLNKKNPDGFMEALTAQRGDLKGLPFRMGADCRTRVNQSMFFASLAGNIHAAVHRAKTDRQGGNGAHMESCWAAMTEAKKSALIGIQEERTGKLPNSIQMLDQLDRAMVAAATQVLGPEPASFRVGMAKFFADIPHEEATKALARLAIFSPEDDVRQAAIDGLKNRRPKDYADILMQGFQYPLPAAPMRSALALIKLERKELTGDLVSVLEKPDPRLPIKRKVDGKEVAVVRELVRVNHHRNCILCHSPGNTADVPDGVLKVAVPLPGEPLPQPSEGYNRTAPPPEIVVRLDTTYLRQDFSMMMQVPKAFPWPDRQRFDFLVRTRELTPALAAEWREEFTTQTAGQLSPYRLAAVHALRELTGRDAEPTAAAWREALR